jgi:hypothetical protein
MLAARSSCCAHSTADSAAAKASAAACAAAACCCRASAAASTCEHARVRSGHGQPQVAVCARAGMAAVCACACIFPTFMQARTAGCCVCTCLHAANGATPACSPPVAAGAACARAAPCPAACVVAPPHHHQGPPLAAQRWRAWCVCCQLLLRTPPCGRLALLLHRRCSCWASLGALVRRHGTCQAPLLVSRAHTRCCPQLCVSFRVAW